MFRAQLVTIKYKKNKSGKLNTLRVKNLPLMKNWKRMEKIPI